MREYSRTEIVGLLGIQYGRDDVEYATFYSPWMRRLAQTRTVPQLLRELGVTGSSLTQASRTHERAIRATHSMQAQSQRRARAGNVVAAAGERVTALRGALEIHALFPEHALSHPEDLRDG